MLLRGSVKISEDLTRILALPKRQVRVEDAEALVPEWTDLLRTPAGARAGVKLLRWQAYLLRELYQYRGAFALLPVGQGKTLPSYLAATVLDAKRPILVIPATLQKQTRDSFAEFSRHWHVPFAPPEIVTVETLGQPQSENLLRGSLGANGVRVHGLRPDLVIIDEADTLRNQESAAVARLDRWSQEAQEECSWLIMSGTAARLSILDFSHLLIWALRDRAPVPLNHAECTRWAAALDERVRGKRLGVGELRKLFLPDGNLDLSLVDKARRGFCSVLQSTPGVLIVDEDSTGGLPLEICQIKAPDDPILDPHFEKFRVEGITPDGRAMAGPLEVYRHEAPLGTGMFQHWVPHPSETDVGREWLLRRNLWLWKAEELIKASESTEDPIDTEGVVAKRFPELEELRNWLAVKDTFTPNSVTEWITDSVVNWVLALLRESPQLAWCWNPDFAEALEWSSRHDGGPALRLYSKDGEDDEGKFIGRAPGDRSAIMTCLSNLRGRNLQQFHDNLLINPPPSGRYLEQLFGRTHRRNQTRGVRVRYLITSGGVSDAFESAVREAEFGRNTFALTQKILRADICRVSLPLNTYRWARKTRQSGAGFDDSEE